MYTEAHVKHYVVLSTFPFLEECITTYSITIVLMGGILVFL